MRPTEATMQRNAPIRSASNAANGKASSTRHVSSELQQLAEQLRQRENRERLKRHRGS
jgi:hypothetical protein